MLEKLIPFSCPLPSSPLPFPQLFPVLSSLLNSLLQMLEISINGHGFTIVTQKAVIIK